MLLLVYLVCTTNHKNIPFGYLLHLLVQGPQGEVDGVGDQWSGDTALLCTFFPKFLFLHMFLMLSFLQIQHIQFPIFYGCISCIIVPQSLVPYCLCYSFFLNIYLFIFMIYSHYKFTILTRIYDEIFSHFIIWKAGDHYLVTAHKFNMFCVDIFLQNEDCEDMYLIFRLVQYIIRSGVFSLHILLFCSDTNILCFPLVTRTLYISSPLVSYS